MGTRNSNGYGTISKLKGNRSRPYMIRITVYDEDGIGSQKIIGYGRTKEEANTILAEYHNIHFDVDREKVTLQDVFDRWLEVADMSRNSLIALKSAYKHIKHLSNIKYIDLKPYDIQRAINLCPKSAATKQQIKKLWYHLDRFAYANDIISKMSYMVLTAPALGESSRTIFTDKEIEKLWDNKDIEMSRIALIYLYSGFRLNEILQMPKENIKDGCFKGGLKTKAGKNRIVPIHPKIKPFVDDFIGYGRATFLPYASQSTIFHPWKRFMSDMGMDHVVHECRHTFETRLNNAGANQKCIDMLMGHSSGNIGTKVYTHKTIDQLKETILLLN